MSELRDNEAAFLRDLADILKNLRETAVRCVAEPNADLQWVEDEEAWRKLGEILRESASVEDFEHVLSNVLKRLIHSTLVSLDGGTALSEKTSITIVDAEGKEFRKYLHEFWPEISGDAA